MYLGAAFPDSFRRIVSKYGFGRFTIGYIQFGFQGDYLANLVRLNAANEFDSGWWGMGRNRPAGFLCVGGGDPFTLLLDLSTGKLAGFEYDRPWQQALPAAADLELFLRGMGTMLVSTDRAMTRASILPLVQGDAAFWREWQDPP